MSDERYPELARLKAVKEEAAVVQAFLDWLHDEAGYRVCERTDQEWDNTWMPVREHREQLMARFFDIDLDKVSRERDQVLEDWRQSQGIA